MYSNPFSLNPQTRSYSACADCDNGRAAYSINTASCLYCDPGTYATQGLTSCINCPAGNYSTIGMSFCYSCQPGYFSASVADTNCTPCEMGMRACLLSPATLCAFQAFSSLT